MFYGLGMNPGTLAMLAAARSRSISPENPTGAPAGGARAVDGNGAHAARELGPGWKVSPSLPIQPGEKLTLADVEGPGAIEQIWMTLSNRETAYRDCILRCHWDGVEQPSVEAPVGDFFCCGWGGDFFQLSSLMVCHNPGNAFNCYWEMPFRTHARITLENRGAVPVTIYYQINYVLTEVPEEYAYFHASFRRSNPSAAEEPHVLLDGVSGPGHYVGTYLAWGVHNNGWWGEGEIKFYIDDDDEFPTICGTGTEDYFCGSYNFENPATHRYQPFSTPYSGLPQVIEPDGLYRSQQRFGLYRWHITDPVRFQSRLKVTIQALGWRSGGRYLRLRDDIASTVFWYQALPAAPFPPLPSPGELEVI